MHPEVGLINVTYLQPHPATKHKVQETDEESVLGAGGYRPWLADQGGWQLKILGHLEKRVEVCISIAGAIGQSDGQFVALLHPQAQIKQLTQHLAVVEHTRDILYREGVLKELIEPTKKTKKTR